ncbi:hypothetical protein BN1723_013286 [Verticillium longisporum]|uniref:Uncharacterized protein n=1 Tax=Verticillium longisporum TaxID=100787 RepID=A0A0G4LR16_VERLO|nr:hypothetical protein BN1723_013286 [Verticillium longisporum]
MHFPTVAVFAALLSGSALAAPAANVKSMAVASTTWTIENTRRACKANDCTWTFSVNTGSSNTPCTFHTKSTGSALPSRANGEAQTCGPYTVTSSWSGQFGEGNGFTTLAVVNRSSKQIVWPAYTDKQLAKAVVVKPNQSYPLAKAVVVKPNQSYPVQALP